MRIDNTFLQNLEVPKNPTANGSARSTDARQSGGAGSDLEAQSEHVPSPELQHYTALLNQEPQVRHERLREVAQRLQQGYYATAASAQRTAAAILGSPD